MHQPLIGGISGQASDIIIQANEMSRIKDRLLEIFVNATGKTRDVLEKDMDRDYYLDAHKAVEYGLIDQVLSPRQAPKVLAAGARVAGALSDGDNKLTAKLDSEKVARS
jgi:ATP-dependent Clp protease protease subunit